MRLVRVRTLHSGAGSGGNAPHDSLRVRFTVPAQNMDKQAVPKAIHSIHGQP